MDELPLTPHERFIRDRIEDISRTGKAGYDSMTSLRFHVQEIVTHQRMHPAHGSNCACMDEVVRRIRRDITDGFKPTGANDAEKTKALASLDYVLRLAIQNPE